MNRNHLPNAPLAERMRPQTLDQYIGQQHLIGQGGALRHALDSGYMPCIILWGPPGVGKTTLACIISRSLGRPFHALSAINSGVKDIRDIIEQAERQGMFNTKSPLLFIDEIHRFSKSQQDSLLSAVERGVVTLIGATTENPSFEVIPALLSRCQVHVLKPLGTDDLMAILQQAITQDKLLISKNMELRETDSLMRLSGGDARRLLILSSEDIGLANPDALVMANATFEAVAKIGWPESRIVLSQCAIYLACSPKSNSAYVAIGEAQAMVRQTGNLPVPLHLRNAPTRLMKDLDYGAGYKYSHSMPQRFSPQEYLPADASGTAFYSPADNKWENAFRERMRALWRDKYGY